MNRKKNVVPERSNLSTISLLNIACLLLLLLNVVENYLISKKKSKYNNEIILS